MRRQPNRERAEGYLEKARWNLRVMDHNYKGGFHDWAIVSGYYAMYMAALGALWLIGISGKDHLCVAKALRFYLIQKGKLESRYASVFQKAQELESEYAENLEEARRQRLKVQYDIVDIGKEDARWTLQNSRQFVTRIMRLLQETK